MTRIGLLANIPTLEAAELLEKALTGQVELTAESIYKLAIEAGETERAANLYRIAAIKSRWKPTER